MLRYIMHAEEEAREHRDPSGSQAVADIFNILWRVLVLLVIFVFVMPFRAVRWFLRRDRRNTQVPPKRRTDEPEVWRQGYH